jgi:hypothetical protein
MRAGQHVRKAERIEESMRRLDVDKDYETVIENCMLAGTHYLNASLHLLGITGEGRDQLHSDKPRITRTLSPDLVRALAALKVIEDLRPPYVRGAEPYRPAVGRKCLQAYARVKAFALKVTGPRAA